MGVLHKLGNGLALYVDPMPYLSSAAIGVWTSAGAIDESAGENGVAHLLEHMAFKGTTRRSAREIAEEMEAVGGHLNAATSYSNTGYYARVLADDLDIAFDLLADIIRNPAFDEEELEREKNVVLQEIGEAADTPDDALFELLQSLAFADQSLGRPILGHADDVRRHDRTALKQFMDRLYIPERMVVSVSGGIDADRVAEMTERYFGDLNSPSAGPQRSKPFHTAGVAHDARELEQTHIAVSLQGSALKDQDYFATRLLAEILGGGMSSKLFQEVREARGLAYSVYAYADAYEDIGALGFYVGVDEGNGQEALEASFTQIAQLADKVDQASLDRARAMLRSSMVIGLENAASRAERAANNIMIYGEVLSEASILAQLDAVKTSDIEARARAVFDHKLASLAVVGPADFDKLKQVVCAAGLDIAS